MNIEGLKKGCLFLSEGEYIKRGMVYYEDENGEESISQGDFLFRF